MKCTLFLMGGTGNQLFQIAKAIQLKEYGYSVEISRILCEKNFFTRLLKWTIHDKWLEEKFFHEMGFKTKKTSVVELIKLAILFLLRMLNKSQSPGFDTNEPFLGVITGYFQSAKNYPKIQSRILVNALNGYLNINYNTSPYVAIHIRGGDFAYENRINYQKILDEFISPDGLSRYIVTNDANYVKELSPALSNWNFHEGKDAEDDFIFLAASAMLLASNSTFCFWAALCNPHRTLTKFPEDTSLSNLWIIANDH